MIHEFRTTLTVDDFESAIRFYRDALGLTVRQSWDGADGRGVILELPRATLELLDRRHADAVDRIETGRVIGGDVRLVVQVNDLETATKTLEHAGARQVAGSVHTPWKDHNQRMTTPDGRQLTLFQPEE